MKIGLMAAPLAPLKHTSFRLLVAGRVITVTGNAIAPIALAFAVLDLTGSATSLGVVVGARSLANVAFVLWGGLVADRLPRAVVLVGSSVLSGLTQGVVAVLVLSHTASIPLLTVLSAINGMATAFAFPASSALTPQTVPHTLRQQANGLLRLGTNGSMILGASLAGALTAAAGPGWGLALDAVSFLLAGCCFARIPAPALPTQNARTTGLLTDLYQGWETFTALTWLRLVVVSFMVINAALVASVQVLGPQVADGTIGRSGWGIVLAAQTVGMVAGGLIALRVHARRLLFFGVTCVGFTSLLPLVLAVAPTIPLLMAAAFVAGLGIEQFAVAWDTSIQDHVPPDRLARVYSYDMMGSIVAIPIAEMSVGSIADILGVRATLLDAFVLVTLATSAMVASRSVRHLKHATHACETGTALAEP